MTLPQEADRANSNKNATETEQKQAQMAEEMAEDTCT